MHVMCIGVSGGLETVLGKQNRSGSGLWVIVGHWGINLWFNGGVEEQQSPPPCWTFVTMGVIVSRMFAEIFKKVSRRKNNVMVWQVTQKELIICYQMQRPFGTTLWISPESVEKCDYQITAEVSQKFWEEAKAGRGKERHFKTLNSLSLSHLCSNEYKKHSALLLWLLCFLWESKTKEVASSGTNFVLT